MSPAPNSVQSDPRAASVLVRINALAWGVATGAVLGVGLCLATLILIWKGGTEIGPTLGRLSNVLPGYSVSYPGAFLGLVYGFFIGYGLGRVLGPKRDLADTQQDADTIHVRLSPQAWSFTLGALLALVLFLVTNYFWLRGGEHVGPLLEKLHVYFPGYSVDFPGSLIGGAYMLALGWLVGQGVALVYNRAVARAEA